MPAAAYQIGISFVSDASKVTTSGDAIVRVLERIQAAQRASQIGFNEMAAALRGAARVADALAGAMDRVARAATAAAQATSKIRVAAGGGGGSDGGGSAPRPVAAVPVAMPGGGGYVSPYSAAAGVGGAPRRLGYTGPAGLIGYDPVQRTVVRGSTVPTYGSVGPGVLVGPPTGPGSALVVAGSATGGGDASYRGATRGTGPSIAGGPSLGALVPAAAGGGVATRTGFTMGGGPGGIPLTGGPLVNLAGRNLPGITVPRLTGLSPYGRMLGGYLGYEGMKGAFEQGADVDDIIAKMGAMQVMGANGAPTAAFTPTQIEQAKTQAMATMRRVPGLGYGQGLDVILQTAGLLGSSGKALELAPQLSFDAQVLSRYGKGDAIGQIEKGVQAGELTGLWSAPLGVDTTGDLN